MSRLSRRQRCRRRQHLFALPGAEPMRICVGFCLNIFCSTWLVTHLYSARPGQASRCVRDPATTCFVWKRHRQGYDLDIAFKIFQVRCPGTWLESCWMNLSSRRGSASWFACKVRSKWATPAQCCWTRSLAAFRGLELGSWVSLPYAGLWLFNPGFWPFELAISRG